jgi:hypothetical protein
MQGFQTIRPRNLDFKSFSKALRRRFEFCRVDKVPLYVKFVEIVFFKSLFFILKILFLNYFNIIFLINKK